MIERAHSISLEAVRSVFAVPLDARSEKSELNDGDETRTMRWLRLQVLVETITKENFADDIFTDSIQKALQKLRGEMDAKSFELTRGLRSDLNGMIELLENAYKEKKEERLRKEKEDKEERKEKEDKEERKEKEDKEERRFTAILVAATIAIVAVSIGIAIKF